MSVLRTVFCLACVLAWSQTARAQVPFFFPGATAFTPEISIANSGVLQDVQATVSADQKYVTLNMRAQNTSLLALKEFQFQQQPALGFVGLPAPAPAKNNNGKNNGAGAANLARNNDDPATAVRTSPSEILTASHNDVSILQRPGMTRLGATRALNH
ncbi:MAG: hypothetical protein JWN24_852 [Phycisphaerales bacterium]|nr:hypothetical protein [Phycisphaerales bacterium]